MRALLAFCFVAMATATQAEGETRLVPPARFDYEPRAPYKVLNIDVAMLNTICPSPFGQVWGCTSTRRHVIWLRSGMNAGMRAAVLRHEKAHLNGWRH